jgi:hypothetical protein
MTTGEAKSLSAKPRAMHHLATPFLTIRRPPSNHTCTGDRLQILRWTTVPFGIFRAATSLLASSEFLGRGRPEALIRHRLLPGAITVYSWLYRQDRRKEMRLFHIGKTRPRVASTTFPHRPATAVTHDLKVGYLMAGGRATTRFAECVRINRGQRDRSFTCAPPWFYCNGKGSH